MRAAVAGQGYEFIFINATTGLRTISPALATNTQIARESGDLTGFYHWSKTLNDGVFDPVGEAKHFVADSGLKVGDIVALDHEEALGTWAQRVAYADAWMTYVADATGAKPLLYINGSWLVGLWNAATPAQRARLFAHVWYARPTGAPGNYGTNPLYDPATYPGVHVDVHQYTVDPFMGGTLDRNWTPNLRALKALGATKEPS